jgi:hypothetical protein
MNDFVTGIGWFVIAALTLALACGMICLVLTCYEKAMQRFAWAVDAQTRMELGRSIGASSWWFSEHPETSLALRILAERLGQGLSPDPDQWRDQWRKGLKSDSAGDSQKCGE